MVADEDVVVPVAVVVVADDEDDDDDDDDELDPDDVEAGLDVILKDRLVVVDEQDDEDDEVPDADDRAEGSTKVAAQAARASSCASPASW